ncbi:helix-turn-helix domain-containing protein [Gymnodinialimonas sp.]
MTIQQPISPALDAFGKAIKAERLAREWSLTKLAEKALGNPDRKGYCSQVEKGLRNLSEGTIRSFARVLDLPASATDPLTGHLLPPEDDEGPSDAAAAALLVEVEALRDKLKLSEAIAVAIAYKYADGNPTDIEGALKGLESALELAAKEQQRGALPSNHEDAAEAVIQRINDLNNRGEIDTAYADLQREAAERAERREAMLAEDTRILDLLITQAAMANDADGYAQAHLQRVELDSPSAEDTFHRLRNLLVKRYEVGARLGTPFALTSAAGLARKCADIAPTPYLRAMAQNDLAVTLDAQGTRIQGAEGNTLLSEAVDSYRDALRVRTEADHPVEWATTMQNLAGALTIQGIRSQGAKGNALLAEAVDSYRTALRARKEADHPMEWAMTMQNLGNVLAIQGKRTHGAEGNALLAEAVDRYRSAQCVYTEADHPVGRAVTMHNLGNTLAAQGLRTHGAEGKDLLADAVESYRSALRVTTEVNHPVDWAMTQENLAYAELSRAMHDTTVDPRAHLDAALTHIKNALRIFDPVHMSYRHTEVTTLRTEILKDLDALPPSSSS